MQRTNKRMQKHRDRLEDPIENRVAMAFGDASNIGLLISFGLETFVSVSKRGGEMCVAIGCRM